MIATYFILIGACWLIGLILWKKIYVNGKEEN